MNPRIIENQRRIALELIDRLATRLTPGRPFLEEIRREFQRRKHFGARDRRLYRELVFTWLRFRGWFDRVRAAVGDERAADLLVLLAPDSPEVLPLQTALEQPGGLARKAGNIVLERLAERIPEVELRLEDLLPGWFRSHCPALFEPEEIWLQTRRPPFWLRAQRGTADELVHELGREGIRSVASPRLPGAVMLHEYIDFDNHPLVESGRAEIQDIGSQALLHMARPLPGEHWLDLCAGGGGKTLQLVAMVGADGRVTAHDVRRDALMETRRRLNRAGLKNARIEPVLPEAGFAAFDGVLVDAPCSASGTWRRHPFLKHQINPILIKRHARDQLRILERGADRVRPGGRLLYATCSLSRHENEEVVTAFLKARGDFHLEKPAWLPKTVEAAEAGWVTLLPSALNSDGYFLACLRRED